MRILLGGQGVWVGMLLKDFVRAMRILRSAETRLRFICRSAFFQPCRKRKADLWYFVFQMA
jgi:hypothetical protein